MKRKKKDKKKKGKENKIKKEYEIDSTLVNYAIVDDEEPEE